MVLPLHRVLAALMLWLGELATEDAMAHGSALSSGGRASEAFVAAPACLRRHAGCGTRRGSMHGCASPEAHLSRTPPRFPAFLLLPRHIATPITGRSGAPVPGWGKRQLEWAADERVAVALRMAGRGERERMGETLFEAVKDGDVARVRQLCEGWSGPNVGAAFADEFGVRGATQRHRQ